VRFDLAGSAVRANPPAVWPAIATGRVALLRRLNAPVAADRDWRRASIAADHMAPVMLVACRRCRKVNLREQQADCNHCKSHKNPQFCTSSFLHRDAFLDKYKNVLLRANPQAKFIKPFSVGSTHGEKKDY
jgi:hypothetical protein